ncbi:MAG: A24 family peptidase [Rickettsiales bacterium]|nr:A24 family peptidase [Rickettsiales bacterium]
MTVTVVLFFGHLCLGVLVGSFLTAFIDELLVEEGIFTVNPQCTNCSNSKVKSLASIISLILQRGKCPECGRKMSPMCLALGPINATVYAMLSLTFGFRLGLIYLSLLFSLLLAIVVVDLKTYEIPILFQMLLCVFALLQIILTPTEPLSVLARIIVYFVVIKLLKTATEKLTGREVIGEGDVKLIVICGSMLNLEYMSPFLLFTGILGIILGLVWKEDKKWKLFPLSPAIALTFYPLLIHHCSFLWLRNYNFIK